MQSQHIALLLFVLSGCTQTNDTGLESGGADVTTPDVMIGPDGGPDGSPSDSQAPDTGEVAGWYSCLDTEAVFLDRYGFRHSSEYRTFEAVLSQAETSDGGKTTLTFDNGESLESMIAVSYWSPWLNHSFQVSIENEGVSFFESDTGEFVAFVGGWLLEVYETLTDSRMIGPLLIETPEECDGLVGHRSGGCDLVGLSARSVAVDGVSIPRGSERELDSYLVRHDIVGERIPNPFLESECADPPWAPIFGIEILQVPQDSL